MFNGSPVIAAWWRCRNDPITLYFVHHHLHCQFPSKSQRRIRFLVPCTCTSLPHVYLRDRHQESKLSIGPPLCLPHGLQPNRIMATIIYIVDPVLRFVVSAEGLPISKRSPFSIDAPPGRVTFHLVQGPVR
jgi:hypothetical protein